MIRQLSRKMRSTGFEPIQVCNPSFGCLGGLDLGGPAGIRSILVTRNSSGTLGLSKINIFIERALFRITYKSSYERYGNRYHEIYPNLFFNSRIKDLKMCIAKNMFQS